MSQIERNNRLKKLRQKRVRSRIRGTAERPRLSVYRSNRHIYAQLIDDVARITIIAVSDHELEKAKSKIEAAKFVGVSLAKKAKVKKIVKISFDRSYYRYHGRVKQLADSAREAGLEF